MTSAVPGSADVDTLRRVQQRVRRKRGRQRSVDDIIMDQRLAAAERQMAAVIEEQMDRAGTAEIERAIAAGIVNVDPLGMDQAEFTMERMLARMTDLMVDSIAPSASTYPMFDDTMGDLLKAMIKEGMVPDANVAPARQVAVAGPFIDLLDAFPDAPMDVVLDAREQLRRPLVRFRAAMVELTAGLRDLAPWDPNFRQVANDLWQQHVAPALLELDDVARQLRLHEQLRREFMSGSGTKPAAAAFALAATSVAQLPDIGKAALTAAPAAGLGAQAAAPAIGRAATRRVAAAPA